MAAGIGGITFDFLSGAPDKEREMTEDITAPGTDGIRLQRIGERAEIAQFTAQKFHATAGASTTLLDSLKAIKAGDSPVTLTDDTGRDFSVYLRDYREVLFKVIAGATDGSNYRQVINLTVTMNE